ncbi:MAG: RimK family alpha-L-glutamate ligase [Zetaproteobacteria bacterium]|nr:RimK family alpha-L-glutamate ligase [Zetaproteobacteria bacterium]
MPDILDSSGHTPLMGLVKLARHAFSGADLTPIAQQLATRFEHRDNDASALMDLATIHFLMHIPETALEFQHHAMQLQLRYTLSSSPMTANMRLLALHGDGDLMDNLPVEFLLIGSQSISMDAHYIALGDELPDDLNDYDIILIAVGESDRNKPLLRQLNSQLQACPIPIINHPEYIMQTTREGAAEALKNCQDVMMPMSTRMTRENIQAMRMATQNHCTFPIIIRPIESHAGHGLARLDSPKNIPAYLAEQTQDTMFYISPYVDYSSEDRQFRKYRVVLIEGRPFLAHLAISSHWIVHYLNADMLGDMQKCVEEAETMQYFDDGFGKKHTSAFQAIYEALPLDYLILDCAESHEGKLLVFEVDTSAIVHDMDPIDLFPYKQPQMHKIFHAFQAMLTTRVNT